MCSIMTIVSKQISRGKIKENFARTIKRGPDKTRFVELPIGCMGFHRLAIMGLTQEGMQPFSLGGNMLVCNGEIYGFRKLKEDLIKKEYKFLSDSDCEILLPLYKEMGTKMFPLLGSEFALCIYDSDENTVIAARDPIGIRPLFYGYLKDGGIAFASEACVLEGLCEVIKPFPPGHYYKDGKFVRYISLTDVKDYVTADVEEACSGIRERLVASVKTRLDADAPLGFLLSGGLDSSLVCGIAAKIFGKAHPIKTFAIGMEKDAIDLKYAREAAKYIGAEHTEVFMTREDVIRELPNVIRLLATWDITTIRASMGMYLCCKWIHENTDIRVLMTGEISDELFGYKTRSEKKSG